MCQRRRSWKRVQLGVSGETAQKFLARLRMMCFFSSPVATTCYA